MRISVLRQIKCFQKDKDAEIRLSPSIHLLESFLFRSEVPDSIRIVLYLPYCDTHHVTTANILLALGREGMNEIKFVERLISWRSWSPYLSVIRVPPLKRVVDRKTNDSI